MKIKIRNRQKLKAGLALQKLDSKTESLISVERKALAALLVKIINANDATIADVITDLSAYSEGSSVEVAQGSDGKLVKVVTHSTATTPTAFPTIVKVVASGKTITIDSSGVKYEHGDGRQIKLDGTGVVSFASTGDYVQTLGDALQTGWGSEGVSFVKGQGLHVFSGANDCYLQFSALTKNMSFREIDVCDGGVAKKMLVLASAPYV